MADQNQSLTARASDHDENRSYELDLPRTASASCFGMTQAGAHGYDALVYF